jgi:hypothetical protein
MTQLATNEVSSVAIRFVGSFLFGQHPIHFLIWPKPNFSMMSERCEGCAAALESEWVACPFCGRPVSGKASSEKLVRIVTKVGVDLLEAGLMEAEANAEEKGNKSQAAKLALARNLAKETAPKIADAVTTYVYQRQALMKSSHSKKSPPTKSGSPD